MKVSKFVTKVIIRVFFIAVFVALIPFIQGDQTKLQHVYLTFHHPWEMVFPAILVVGFITLLTICALKKYEETDLNWLLVLNTVILLAYGIALFIRVVHMV